MPGQPSLSRARRGRPSTFPEGRSDVMAADRSAAIADQRDIKRVQHPDQQGSVKDQPKQPSSLSRSPNVNHQAKSYKRVVGQQGLEPWTDGL